MGGTGFVTFINLWEALLGTAGFRGAFSELIRSDGAVMEIQYKSHDKLGIFPGIMLD